MPSAAAIDRWTQVVVRQEQSGKTIRAFCAANKVNANTLGWWRHHLGRARRRPAAPEFVEITIAEPVAATVVLVLDEHPAHVVIDPETDLVLLRRVLEALC